MKSVMKSATIEKLIAYGNKNPNASDRAEGIARWWVKMPLEEVLPALESLVEQGTWEKLKGHDGALYRPRNGSDSEG